MIYNKKGFMRVVEAVIAILIVVSVLLIVTVKNKPTTSSDLSQKITPLLEEIAQNITLRDSVLTSDHVQAETLIYEYLTNRISDSFLAYNVSVCPAEDICSLSSYPSSAGEVYSKERIISSVLDSSLSPKKVKIYIWRKSLK